MRKIERCETQHNFELNFFYKALKLDFFAPKNLQLQTNYDGFINVKWFTIDNGEKEKT